MLGEPATRLCWEDTEKLFLVYLTLAAIEEMEGMANSMRVKETALAGPHQQEQAGERLGSGRAGELVEGVHDPCVSTGQIGNTHCDEEICGGSGSGGGRVLVRSLCGSERLSQDIKEWRPTQEEWTCTWRPAWALPWTARLLLPWTL
jgi:hypothetical protein